MISERELFDRCCGPFVDWSYDWAEKSKTHGGYILRSTVFFLPMLVLVILLAIPWSLIYLTTLPRKLIAGLKWLFSQR